MSAIPREGAAGPPAAGGPSGLRAAYVQTPDAGDRRRLRPSSGTAADDGSILRELSEHHGELARRGVPVLPFHPSDLRRLRADLPSPGVVVSADLGVCWALLDGLGLCGAIAGSYPDCLAPHLHRRHWFCLGRDLRASLTDAGAPVFVKPRRLRVYDGMRFRGRVVPDAASLGVLPPALEDEWFFCSEPLGWASEYRCYILHSRLLGLHPYRIAGAPVSRVDCAQLEELLPALRPTASLVGDMVARLDASGQAVAGYGLDIGLDANGAMSLIEMNDALALINNGLPVSDHLDLHAARWAELMGMAKGGGAGCRHPEPVGRPGR